MKKIAIVTNNIEQVLSGGAQNGGGAVVTKNLIREYAGMEDVSLTVFTEAGSDVQLDNVRIVEIPHPNYTQSYISEIDKIVQKENFDLVLSTNILKLYRTNLLQCHSPQHKCSGGGVLVSALKKFFGRKKLSYYKNNFSSAGECDFIAVSDTVRKDYQKNFNLQPEQIRVVYPACKQVYKVLPELKKNKEITFGVVANSSINKGGHLLLLALGLVKLCGYKFNLKMIAPKYKKDLLMQGLIKIFGMSKQVEPLPKQSDMTNFYSSIDVLVLPSRHEAFGLVVLEAMSHAKPCIVSSTAGAVEIITEDNGFVFNRMSLKAFVNTIKRVIKIYNEDFGKFKGYCESAFETSKSYTWERFARDVLSK